MTIGFMGVYLKGLIMNIGLKKRNWAIVVYPSSAPTDWHDYLRLRGVSCAISPLHDKDVKDDGKPKEPHYHVILCFDGPTTINNVYAILRDLGQNLYAVALDSVLGYYRYLTHEDDPNKPHYDSDDIVLLNGFDPTLLLNNVDNRRFRRDIHHIVIEQGFTEYSDLLDYLLDYDDDLYEFASTHTILFNTYITSIRHKRVQSMSDTPLL